MLENQTIRQKLTIIIMLTSTVVIVLGGTVIAIFELHSHRSQAAGDLETIAKLIGHNCQAALTFDVPEDAEESCQDAIDSCPEGCIEIIE